MNLFQSKKWQKLQQDLGETCFYEKNRDCEFLAVKKNTPVGPYLYLPYGPDAETEAGFRKVLKEVMELAKREKVFFVRIEPQNRDFIKCLPKNIKKTKDQNPKDTWRLDLTQPKEGIVSNFSHGIRNAYNTFEKRGIKVEVTKDTDKIKHLVALQKVIFGRKNLQPFSEEYLKTELRQPFTELYLAKFQPESSNKNDGDGKPKSGEILAASLFFDYGDTRYYMQSAANNSYKNLPSTVAILTSAIFDAKEKGIKYFDFWGIAPEDADKSHPWAGFTKFKKSFGGEAVHYVGTYDVILKPTKYRLYQLMRKVHLMMRHVGIKH